MSGRVRYLKKWINKISQKSLNAWLRCKSWCIDKNKMWQSAMETYFVNKSWHTWSSNVQWSFCFTKRTKNSSKWKHQICVEQWGECTSFHLHFNVFMLFFFLFFNLFNALYKAFCIALVYEMCYSKTNFSLSLCPSSQSHSWFPRPHPAPHLRLIPSSVTHYIYQPTSIVP